MKFTKEEIRIYNEIGKRLKKIKSKAEFEKLFIEEKDKLNIYWKIEVERIAQSNLARVKKRIAF